MFYFKINFRKKGLGVFLELLQNIEFKLNYKWFKKKKFFLNGKNMLYL